MNTIIKVSEMSVLFELHLYMKTKECDSWIQQNPPLIPPVSSNGPHHLPDLASGHVRARLNRISY